MQHRVFGGIERNEEMGRWTGRVQIDFFSAYDTAAADACAERLGRVNWRATADKRYQNGDFELDLIGPGRGKPSRGQEKVFLDFLKNRDVICNRVIDAIVDHYRRNWGDWRASAEPGRGEFDSDDLMIPELTDRDGLKGLIRLDGLSVLDPGLLGFCFDCTWDPEHGLGVLVRGGRVSEIGENDITWRDPEFAGREDPPEPVTQRQIDTQRGIAAVKRLGGVVTREHTEAGEHPVQVDLLRNGQIEDADLKSLEHFWDLDQFKLASDRVTDGGLDGLRKFKTLRLLQLSGARITDAGLERLRGFNDLKALYLSGTKVTDAGLKELRRLPALAGLHLNETDVTDVGMMEIGALTGLKHLELSGTKVTDAGMRELNGLKALITLNLQGTQITGAGLAALKDHPSLRYLNLSRCDVTDESLEPLKALRALRSLKLTSTATTDAGADGLRQALTSLQVVR